MSVDLSLVFPYHLSWPDALAVVRAAEAAQVPRVWVFENPRDRGAFVTLGAILGATHAISVGIGVVTPYVRLSETTAMEAFQARVVGGERAVIGLGAGSRAAADSVGAHFEPPLQVLPELIDLIRGYRPLSASPEDPAAPPTVYVAATGPRMLDLAGSIADGVILSMHAPPAALRQMVGAVREAAAAAGRPETPPIVAYRHVVVGASEEEALDSARRELAPTVRRLGDAPVFRRMIEAGPPELESDRRLAVEAADGSGGELEAALTERFVRELCSFGTIHQVLDEVKGIAGESGVDEMALFGAGLTVDQYNQLFASLPG